MKKDEKRDLALRLMKERGLDKKKFVALTGMSERTYERIEEDGNPNMSTLYQISDVLKVDRSYWITGVIKEISDSTKDGFESPWKEEAYMELKETNTYLQEKLNQAMAMIEKLIAGNPGFPKGLSKVAPKTNTVLRVLRPAA